MKKPLTMTEEQFREIEERVARAGKWSPGDVVRCVDDVRRLMAEVRAAHRQARQLRGEFPLQPIDVEEKRDGGLRFRENAVVVYLLDEGPFDMNHLAARDFPREDREQFAALIGYSLLGFSELSYVADETVALAALASRTR